MTSGASRGLQIPPSPTETPQLSSALAPPVPKPQAPGVVIRQQLAVQYVTVSGGLSAPLLQPGLLSQPSAANGRRCGAQTRRRTALQPGFGTAVRRSLYGGFTLQLRAAGRCVTGSWWGSAEPGGDGIILFLVHDAFLGFPTLSTPDCWEMPALSFLLGLFCVRNYPVPCFPPFGVAFPRGRCRERLMLGGCDGESSRPCFL